MLHLPGYPSGHAHNASRLRQIRNDSASGKGPMLVAGLVQLPKRVTCSPLQRPLMQVFKASFEHT